MVRCLLALLVGLAALLAGCAALPEVLDQPQYHNPFPQLSRVAVLPFHNLSGEPTINQDRFALAYFSELQAIPGFEVVPVGVVKQAMAKIHTDPSKVSDLRKLASVLDVDVLVVGAVTDYSPYYPPRLGLAVDWYAANPCFHPIPAGYGLPWGKAEEEYIPDALVQEAEFALAREQLKTQTPIPVSLPPVMPSGVQQAADGDDQAPRPLPPRLGNNGQSSGGAIAPMLPDAPSVPPNWPDPRGFVPPAPSAQRPGCTPSNVPIISHVRTYNGHDTDFTSALEHYYTFRDDARFGGWQAYLQRSEDFIRFCCHLHITEMLTARGGAGETRVVLRWPFGRYDQ